MSRRLFLQSLTALLSGFALPALTQAKPAAKQWKTLQVSPVARFQYYQDETLWLWLATSQSITLVREPGNHFDQRAVRIDWQGEKLGYISLSRN
jgi:hypothetical protein